MVTFSSHFLLEELLFEMLSNKEKILFPSVGFKILNKNSLLSENPGFSLYEFETGEGNPLDFNWIIVIKFALSEKCSVLN